MPSGSKYGGHVAPCHFPHLRLQRPLAALQLALAFFELLVVFGIALLDQFIDIKLSIDLFVSLIDPDLSLFMDPLLLQLAPHPFSLPLLVLLPVLMERFPVIGHILSYVA